MLRRRRYSQINNEKGIAAIELLPIVFVFVLLINFSLGFFGAIHSGILHSIAARNYTFETMFHRSNLNYHFRNDVLAEPDNHFANKGQRVSGIVSDHLSTTDGWYATQRPIAFTSSFAGRDKEGYTLAARDVAGRQSLPSEATAHNQDIPAMNEAARNDKIGIHTIWLKTVYGICLNAQCGD